jgi:hypothetical protein
MTEFRIKPVKEVIVFDIVQEDLENFLYTCRIHIIPNAIWVEGMIISLDLCRATEKNVERFFEGTRIYDKVTFVKFPEYSKTVKWNGGTYELPLRNYQNFSRFVELAKWIKEQPEWKEKRRDTS